MGSETYHNLKDIISGKYGSESCNIGEDGGFAPNISKQVIDLPFPDILYFLFSLLGTYIWISIYHIYGGSMFSISEGLDLVIAAIDRAGYNGRIELAIDVAATDFCEEPDADMIMVEGISQLCNDLLLSTTGGRLIISSDGVWDALTAEVAFNCSRGLSPEAAAEQIVKVADTKQKRKKGIFTKQGGDKESIIRSNLQYASLSALRRLPLDPSNPAFLHRAV